MKPVERGPSPKVYSAYGDAKPDLIARLGMHCSYCEASADPQNLAVEHIYPKKPHPARALLWSNFLISCNTCNSYKGIHLGNGKCKNLFVRYLWPHLENTFRAYKYHPDGSVDVRTGVTGETLDAAKRTLDMAGLVLSSANAASYQKLGLVYDGLSKRKQQWGQIVGFRTRYEREPTPDNVDFVATNAALMGYFSIWMEAFEQHPEVRRALIRAFQADPACFDRRTTMPVRKGRI